MVNYSVFSLTPGYHSAIEMDNTVTVCVDINDKVDVYFNKGLTIKSWSLAAGKSSCRIRSLGFQSLFCWVWDPVYMSNASKVMVSKMQIISIV